MAISRDSSKVAGYNSQENKLIVYQLVGKNDFRVYKSAKLSEGTKVGKISFSDQDDELII